MQYNAHNPLATQFLHAFGRSLKVGNLVVLPLLASLLTGMVIGQTTSVHQIHGNLATGTNQSDFYRQLRPVMRQFPQLYEQVLASAQHDRALRFRPGGYLVMDEHIIPHESTGIEGAAKFYSPSERTYKFGHSLVAVHYWGGRAEYPVAGAFYRREEELTARGQQKAFRKKNAIAREFIKKMAKDPHAPLTWLFDAFFMTKENAGLLQRLKRFYVSRVKRNWKVTWQGKKYSIAELYDTIPSADFLPTPVRNPKTHAVKTYHAAVRDVWVKKLGMQRLVFVDASRLPPEPEAEHADAEVQVSPAKKKFRTFITNHLDWSAAQVLAAYAVRWCIETAFKDLSQHLGLHSCQWRDVDSQLGFVHASFLCYLFLTWLKVSGDGPVAGQKYKTIGQMREWFEWYCQCQQAKDLAKWLEKLGPGGEDTWLRGTLY